MQNCLNLKPFKWNWKTSIYFISSAIHKMCLFLSDLNWPWYFLQCKCVPLWYSWFRSWLSQKVCNRAFQSVVFNSGQKMALRVFYFIRALTKALTYYYINRSQRHLLTAVEKNWLEGPIIKSLWNWNALPVKWIS